MATSMVPVWEPCIHRPNAADAEDEIEIRRSQCMQIGAMLDAMRWCHSSQVKPW